MGLNLSNRQIDQKLDLDKDAVHDMTTQLREGIEQSKPEVNLSVSKGFSSSTCKFNI
jgi:hypothetical protein